MTIAINILILLGSCFALCLGASWLVDSAGHLARRLGISELVIGLTVVAFGTSAPEMAVTISAALTGQESVSIANVIGSNIFNIGFILGACAAVAVIATGRALIWRDGAVLLGGTALLWWMISDGVISRLDGVILIAGLIGYLVFLFVKREPIIDEDIDTGTGCWKDLLMLPAGLIGIIAGGHFLVSSAVVLARAAGLSEWIIGMTIVAAGTSLPEFVTSLTAVVKKHHGISAGNLIGSNIFNTLGVLGIAGAISPLSVDASAHLSIALLIVLTLLVLAFMRTGWKLVRLEGVILLAVSLTIWLWIFVS